MERAARLLNRLKLVPGIACEQIAVAAWKSTVGPKVAARTRAVTVRGGRLIVEVEDEVWRNQLSALAPLILDRLSRALGEGVVSSLHFRVGMARRGPVREDRLVRGGDEADAIRDPMLGRIYKAKRKKASA